MTTPPPTTPPPPWSTRRVLVTGGHGFLGSAVCRALRGRGVPETSICAPRSRDFDLTRRGHAHRLLRSAFLSGPPDVIVHCAGAVGGIQANRDQPARFFFDNITMALNLAEEARVLWTHANMLGRAAFVQVGSMTSYPADAPMPYREEDLFKGYPPADSAPYGLAKLAAWQLLDAYYTQHGLRSAYLIPTNLYGPGDNIADVRNAHVAGSLIKRFVDAAQDGVSEVVCWGTGDPTREFLFIDDAAEALCRAADFALTSAGKPLPINLGPNHEISIRDLAQTIARVVGYAGKISWDSSKPGGQARRALDASRAAALLGWKAQTPLEEGLKRTGAWYAGTLGQSGPRP